MRSEFSFGVVRAIQLTAHYKAKMMFEKGSATIHLNLTLEEEQWKILGFTIDSKVLMLEHIK